MSLKLAARLVILDPTKILDLNENDTVSHTEDLSAILPPECLAIIAACHRITGTGSFVTYPRSHATVTAYIASYDSALIPITNRELKWKNTVANDDWDIFLLGYFVQKRTR